MFRGLRTQIFLWTILPLALLLLGVAYVGVATHQNAMRDMVAERDGALAQASAARISELLTDHEQHLQNVNVTRPETWKTDIFDGGIAFYDVEDHLRSAVPSNGVWENRRAMLPHEGFGEPFFKNGVWYVLIARDMNGQCLVGALSLPPFSSIAPRGHRILWTSKAKSLHIPMPHASARI